MTGRVRSLVICAAVACVAVLGAASALVLYARSLPLPPELAAAPSVASLEITDRNGVLIREVRTDGAELERPVKRSDLAPSVVPALLAAEDARFFRHFGVDPFAIGRAMIQAVIHRRIVSGASTLTQQLARNVVPRPRTALGKLREMALAIRIERSLSKERILEEYLSRVEFGPGIRGVDAASRAYFDKPASELDLSEAATLVSIPRGPSLYDPRRSLAPVARRRDRVLHRMADHGLALEAAVCQALATPLVLQRRFASGGSEHLALGLARGTVPSGLPRGIGERRIETTLESSLQREVEVLARRAAGGLAAYGATALAVIVVDNASGEVLAYVGSPDYFGERARGANDGVRALRQPGSTLKPFVYAAAMEQLGMTAATILPDVDTVLETGEGAYHPRNYDGRTHGPVRLREALASSLNIVAVSVAEQVGPARVLEVLHRAGFESLSGSSAHYGAALALGDGEVRLSELAEAYVALARGGERIPLSLVRRGFTIGGDEVSPSPRVTSRVVDARTAAILTDVLSDDAARASSFGRDGALAFPFPVAAKTGTSKGFRDNWAAGFTHEVTVAVWAGNFDGTPMLGSTGVTGAGPLFHDALLAAMQGRAPAPLVDHEGLVDVEVCALSGELPGRGCAHRTHELFRPGTEPRRECTFHVAARVDPGNGLLAGPACADAIERTFEAYPPRFTAWAVSAHRPVAPTAFSPRCPGRSTDETTTQVATVQFPRDGAHFDYDPALTRQEILFSARPAAPGEAVRFVLDGRPLGIASAPFTLPWRLVPGTHRLSVESSRTARSRSLRAMRTPSTTGETGETGGTRRTPPSEITFDVGGAG